MRVNELAKECGISSKETLEILHRMGVTDKTHSSALDEEQQLAVRAALGQVVGMLSVCDLAAECEVSVEELLEILEDLEIGGKNAMSPLTSDQVRAVREDLGMLPNQQREREGLAGLPGGAEMEPAPEPDEAEASSAPEPESVAGAQVDDVALEETQEEEVLPVREVDIKGPVSLRELAELLQLKPNVLVAELMKQGVFASINHTLDAKKARELAEQHGFEIKKDQPKPVKAVVEQQKNKAKKKKKRAKDGTIEKTELKAGEMIRPPIVAFLGHVDHGKTSLLDYIRKTRVVAGESGGITQHIGAYTVEFEKHKITFLDTPGHSAFEKMRERGAQLTDIMVLVIAADDGIMPQTKEAIRHARNAENTVIVAINKMDLPSADPLKVRTQLQQAEMVPEDWGGDIGVVEVSAETGQGMDDLLERIALEAEMLEEELKVNPSAPAVGYVVEAQMEPGMGPTANIIVREGTLKLGDGLVCGAHWGKVKSLMDDKGGRVKSAGPSTAVKCLGLTSVPEPGDEWQACASDREARSLAEKFAAQRAIERQQPERAKLSLDDLFSRSGSTIKELPVVIKADVQGSVEAIRYNLEAIQSDKVKLRILDASVGNVSSNDLMKASAGGAIVLGFHIGIESGVNAEAKRLGVEIRLYSVIYELIDQVGAAMKGLLEPIMQEEKLGRAEVKAVFPLGKRGKVAGCLVIEGRVAANARARVLRKKEIIYEGSVVSLRRYQDQVKEVRDGQECGMQFERFSNIEEGDIIETYLVNRIEQEL